MRRTCLIFGGVAFGIIVILILVAVFVGYQRIPPVSVQVEAKNQVAAIIFKPAPDSRFPADAVIPITVLARGKADRSPGVLGGRQARSYPATRPWRYP